MKKYEAPQAQVVNFDNDYVVTAGNNKSWGNGCEWQCATGNQKEDPRNGA